MRPRARLPGSAQPDEAWAAAAAGSTAATGAGRRSLPIHGAVPGDQGRPPGQPALVPHGRFLRAVLRRRRRRLRIARHRADQARQAPGPRHPHVRRADPPRRRISAAADQGRASRRRLPSSWRIRPRRASAARKRSCAGTSCASSRPARSPRIRCSIPRRATISRRCFARADTPRARRCKPDAVAGSGLDRHLDRRVRGGRGRGRPILPGELARLSPGEVIVPGRVAR